MSFSTQKETATMMVVGRMFDLERLVSSKTSGRIHNLLIESHGDRIELTGESRTYYAKQLATQVVLDEYEDVELSNEIIVV